MTQKTENKGFLDRISPFSLILVMVTLTIIGIGLVPMLSMGYMPEADNIETLTINAAWRGVSPKVMEAEVTTKLEGVASMVMGVENVISTTSAGQSSVFVKLKKGVNINSVRFELSSLLKQLDKKLPAGVVGLHLNSSTASSMQECQQLFTYHIAADLPLIRIKDYALNHIKPYIEKIEGIHNVTVYGAEGKYLDVSYQADHLASYGLSSSDLSAAISNFVGQSNIVGDVFRPTTAGVKERITVHLTSRPRSNDIGSIPIKMVDGKMIYLRDVSEINYKDTEPISYFRINGKNTVFMVVTAQKEANILALAPKVRAEIERIEHNFPENYQLELMSDSAKPIQEEVDKLITRTLLSLLILLGFVLLISRSWRYLMIIAVTLFANIFIAVIFYYLLDIQLNLYTMAGIAVSFGMLIDTTIVMVDHYSYYRNRTVFIAILAALLTTICSLVIIFFMPDYIKASLLDFAIIIIINLSVSLVIALLFVPALVEKSRLKWREITRSIKTRRRIVGFSRVYERFLTFGTSHKWLFATVLVLSFGIPLHLLPPSIGKSDTYHPTEVIEQQWYHKLYNATLGCDFYRGTLKNPLEKILGGTFRLFGQNLGARSFSNEKETTTLRISASMPEGSSAAQLNSVVVEMDRFLGQFKEIERFETQVSESSANINVTFKPEYDNGSFPYWLNGQVIAKAIAFGGADWGVYGIDERGFSNSLNTDSKSSRINLKGYNYEILYGIAERLAEDISHHKRVSAPEIMGSSGQGGYYGSASDSKTELYINYDRQKVALYDINLAMLYGALAEKLQKGINVNYRLPNSEKMEISLSSADYDRFDTWQLQNSYLNVSGNPVRYSLISDIAKRKTDNTISRENQVYSLDVAFNFLGSYELTDRFIKDEVAKLNAKLPIGFKAENSSFGWYPDRGEQYWLILLIVVIIFFVCSILFESLIQPFVIMMLIPVSLIGVFLTFYWSGMDFGKGGFAAMVLLCGIVVNAGIYIINEYNHTATRGTLKRYVRAYNHKIIPVRLTIVCTILGLVPFMIDGPKEEFWFPFAVGTAGGLIFSAIALVIFMPIFMLKREIRKPILKQ